MAKDNFVLSWTDEDDAVEVEEKADIVKSSEELTETVTETPVRCRDSRWVEGKFGDQLRLLEQPLNRELPNGGYKGTGCLVRWVGYSTAEQSVWGTNIKLLEAHFPQFDREKKMSQLVDFCYIRDDKWIFQGSGPIPEEGTPEFNSRLVGKKKYPLPVKPITEWEGWPEYSANNPGAIGGKPGGKTPSAQLEQVKSWLADKEFSELKASDIISQAKSVGLNVSEVRPVVRSAFADWVGYNSPSEEDFNTIASSVMAWKGAKGDVEKASFIEEFKVTF